MSHGALRGQSHAAVAAGVVTRPANLFQMHASKKPLFLNQSYASTFQLASTSPEDPGTPAPVPASRESDNPFPNAAKLRRGRGGGGGTSNALGDSASGPIR